MTQRGGIATVADFVSHDRINWRRCHAWLRDKATGYRIVWLREPLPINLARKASRALARPVAAPASEKSAAVEKNCGATDVEGA